MSKVFVVILAFGVAVLSIVALSVAPSADRAKDEAERAAAGVGASVQAPAAHNHATDHGQASTGELVSYAGQTVANAAALAEKHEPYPAELPPVASGPVARVELMLKDVVIEVAPGIKYAAWAFEGGAPGPVIHVREGQKVEITLTNGGAIPHSVDFHAARIAPNVAFRDVAPGESLSYTFVATDPGVFMYHCGTKPVLAHIANGMYGAIVVEPRQPLPAADREYVLVASEWYLNGPGTDAPAAYSQAKARAMMPDWTAFNGYANQYVTHPLAADPGDLVRFWVVDAGPSLDTDFHIVGTLLNRVYPDADMNPAHALENVQTHSVPAGGGAVFEVQIDDPGLYPFVSHSFASVDLGQVGLLRVGTITEP